MLKSLLHSFRQGCRYRVILPALRQEIDDNLEHFHVITQRGFISAGFKIKAWDDYSRLPVAQNHPRLFDYGAAISRVNAALGDVKEYESFYLSSVAAMTRDHAQILHAKKEALDEMTRGLGPFLTNARECSRSITGDH